MRRLTRQARRLGRRGAILAASGLGWIAYGAGLIVVPPTDQRGFVLLTDICPLPRWGALWLLSGAIALTCAPLRRPGWDQAGYVAVIIPPLLWASCNLAAWWPLGVYPRGWALTTWSAISAMLLVCSGWAEPVRTPSGKVVR